VSWYLPTAVPAELAADLVTGWIATTQGTHTLIPDGCVDLLWIDNGTAWVCGPETSAWSFSLPPGTNAVGVRFRPGRAGSVLGFDTAEVRDRRVALGDVLGSRAERRLIQQVGDAAEAAARVGVLQRHASRWLAAAPAHDPIVEAVAHMLTWGTTTTVRAMADTVGLSQRQLHRRCVEAFGYGPATLRKILRLQRFLRLAHRPGSPRDLAVLAVTAGYTDQPHLSRDCRDITGTSPGAILQA
jgi:AraC-like DNA-binding protein